MRTFNYLITVGALACAAIPVQAEIVWNFNCYGASKTCVSAAKDLGAGWVTLWDSTKTYDIKATGYVTSSRGALKSTDVYYKKSGKDETGLGLKGTSDNEIGPKQYLTLDFSDILKIASNEKLLFDSIQKGEGYNLWISNTADLSKVINGKPLFAKSAQTTLSLTGLLNKDDHYVTIEGWGKGGANVLLGNLVVNNPEPGYTALLAAAVAGLGFWRRRELAARFATARSKN